jgi:hypothetical protein
MNETTPELDLLGDALQHAWRADHRRRRAARSRRSRLAIVFGLIALLVAAGAAVGSRVLKSAEDEQRGLLGGHLLFTGTDPKCQQQSASSYSCVLAHPPTKMTFYNDKGRRLTDAYLGVKTATVDADKRVDGGCVSTSADGTKWDCYLGEEAVRHQIVSREFLGKYLPEPPTG